MAQAYIDKIEHYLNTGRDLSANEYTINAFQSTQNEFTSKSNELLNKVEQLPLSVYYNQ